MAIDISSFEEIYPARGGRRISALTLTKSMYFRGNKFFIKEHHLEDTKNVKIKAMNIGKEIVVALTFSNIDEENSFKVSFGEIDEEITSIWFSGRSIFSQFNINYQDVIKTKSLLLKPTIQETHGKKYFIFKIPSK